MAELHFTKFDENSKTPLSVKDGDEKQTYGFLPTYKLQAGNTMGDTTIKGRLLVSDEKNIIRIIIGYF